MAISKFLLIKLIITEFENNFWEQETAEWCWELNICIKHTSTLLTGEEALSRLVQLAKQDAADEWRILYVTPTPVSLSASESPCQKQVYPYYHPFFLSINSTTILIRNLVSVLILINRNGPLRDQMIIYRLRVNILLGIRLTIERLEFKSVLFLIYLIQLLTVIIPLQKKYLNKILK